LGCRDLRGLPKATLMISRIQVGIDVSKKWFDIHVLAGRDEVCARFANDTSGHQAFIDKVRQIRSRKVHVCMEFTGGYETALAIACKNAGFVVSIVDGAKIAHFRRSFSSTGGGTDKKSAYLLARICKERRPEEWFPLPDEFRKLRELVRHRERLIEAKTQWACRAAHDVEDELVSAQRAAIVNVLAIQISDVETRIREHVRDNPNLAAAVRLLQTIPGIGATTAHRLVAEIGPIESYACAKALALAAGLVPIVIHSGQRTPPGKLPVYGNKELRCSFFYPALVCKRNGKGVGPFIQRVAKADKAKMTAITAGMRKLAHIVFGVLSTQTPFLESRMNS